MSVGEETIDEQHKRLFNQLNRLVKALSSGVDMGPVREVIDFLGKHVEEHFSYEENYMKEYNYPKLIEHKKIHKEFANFFEDFKEEFRKVYVSKDFSSAKLEPLLEKAEKYLAEWFVNHELEEDQKYAKWIKKHSKKRK